MKSRLLQGDLLLRDLHAWAVSTEFRFGKPLVFHRNELEEFMQFFHRPITVALFAPTEAHVDLDRMAFGEEFFELFYLNHEVIVRCAGADLYLFHRGAFLCEPFFFLAFFLLVAEFVVAHEACDRRLRIRGNLDEVNAFLRPGEFHGLVTFHYAEVFSGFADHAQFRSGYLVIDAGLIYAFIVYDYIIEAMPQSVTTPTGDFSAYRTLGKKTFGIFLLNRLHASVIFLILAAAIFFLGQNPSLLHVGNVDLNPYLGTASEVAWLLFGFAFLVTLFATWLVYSNYKFFLDENSLKIKRGILNKEEIAIPYRQIQDVDIKRDLSFQMLGVSRLVILTAGHDDENPGDDHTEGIFPALDKDLAEWLRDELLRRANVQKVVEAQ